MATNVDERIVAAKFDASDFEKGVNKTIKKLDELKKELNLKEATKGVEEFAEKTKDSTDSIGNSLEKLTNRFTTFTGMIKQKILSGLADEVANVFLKMEQSVKSFIRSISTAQIGTGMDKYEQMLKAVRVMMAAGESQGSAYEAIGQLRDYSDQTSYSLSQMTDALSKLRAAGVGLDSATQTVEGIANACANAGINATDAQRAFFNLSQAFAKGTLNYTDYKSLELLNMTTAQFKENMLEAAVEAGTLKKVSEGVYQTISTTDKKVKAGKKVTVSNLSEMLKYDFMNNAAMEQLFGKKFYFDEKQFKKYKDMFYDPKTGKVDRQKAIEEAKKDFGTIAVDAYLAAREARSFTDVMNTLKDVVSTGWSTTFEHIFGKLEEAKDFFTDLAENGFADVIYKIGEYRNAVLSFWNPITAEGKGGGGELLRQSILNISEALGTLLDTILQLLPGWDEIREESEDQQPTLKKLGHRLIFLSAHFRDMTNNIKDAVIEFRNFMNEAAFDDGNGGKMTRIEKLREVLTNLGSVFGIIGRVIGLAFGAIAKAYHVLKPVFDGILSFLAKITAPLTELKNNDRVFNDIEHSINNIAEVLKPVAEVLGKIIGFLGEVGAFIAQMAIDTLVGNISFFADLIGIVVEVLTGTSSQKMKEGEGVLERIWNDLRGIMDACKQGVTAVGEFFGALISDIRRLFGLTDDAKKDAKGEEGGIFAGVIEFFNTNKFVQDAKKWVDQAIKDVGEFIKSIPQRVLTFGANIYDTLRKLFWEDKEVTVNGQKQTQSVLTPLGKWCDQAIKDIKEFIKSIPQRIVDGVGKVFNWIDEIFNYLFGEQAAKPVINKGNKDEKVKEETDPIISRFNQFLQGVKTTIVNWFNDLPNKIRNAFKTVGNFATQLFDKLDEFLFGKKVTKKQLGKDKNGKATIKIITTRYKTGFSKFLDTIVQEIKKFITKIPEYIKMGIKGAGDIFSAIVGAIFGKPNGENVTGKDLEDKIAEPFREINLSSILNTIIDIGKEILNQIARIFTGTDDVESNMNLFSDLIAEGIKWIREKAIFALNWVVEFITTIPSRIANLFKGENKDNQEQGPIGKALSDFGEAIKQFILNLPDKVLTIIDEIITNFGDIWERIYKAIIGEADDASAEAAKEATENADNQQSDWDKFVEHLGRTISLAIEKLPKWISNGIDLAITGIGRAFNAITEWLKNDNLSAELHAASEKSMESTGEAISDSTEKVADNGESDLLKSIKHLGQTFYNIITQTIPTFLSEAWKWIVRKGGEVWDAITGLFNGTQYDDGEISGTVTSLGERIKKAILGLPGTIAGAFDTVARAIKDIITGQTKTKVKPPTKEELKRSFDIAETVWEAEHEVSDDIKKRVKQATNSENSGFMSIGEAFKSIFDTLFGENGVLGKDVGQKIADFFLKTIPYYIGKALKALINSIPKIVNSFSEGFSSAVNSVSDDAKDEAEQAEELSTKIGNIFSKVLDQYSENLDNGKLGDVAKSILILLAVMEALKVVREIINMINVTGNLADKASAKNGPGAVFKRIATALIAAFAFVAFISVLPEDQREDAKSVINSLIDLFKLIATLYAVAQGIDLGEDIVGAYKSVKQVGKDVADTSGKGGGATGIKGILAAFGIQSFMEYASNSGNNIVTEIVLAFQNIGAGLKTFSEYLKEVVGHLLEIKGDMDTVIEVMGKAKDLVDKADDLLEYSDNIDMLSNMMPRLTGALALFKTSVTSSPGQWVKAKEITDSIVTLTGMTKEMKEFADFSKTADFEEFKYAIASLGAAVSFYDVKEIVYSDSAISKIVSLISEIINNEDINNLGAIIGSDKLPSAYMMYKGAEKYIILAGAISSIGKAAEGITAEFGTNITNLFDAIKNIELPASKTEIEEISGKMGTFGNGLQAFTNGASGLTDEVVETTGKLVSLMLRVQKDLKNLSQSGADKWWNGDYGIDAFGLKLDTFANHLKSFITQVGNGYNEGFDWSNVEHAAIIMREIASAFNIMNNSVSQFTRASFSDLAKGLAGTSDRKTEKELGEPVFLDVFVRFINGLKAIEITNEQLTKIQRIMDVVKILAEAGTVNVGSSRDMNKELTALANQLDPNNTSGKATFGSTIFSFIEKLNKVEVGEYNVEILRIISDTLTAMSEIAELGMTARYKGIAYNLEQWDHLIESITEYNNITKLQEFFVAAKDFDKEGVQAAKDIFEALAYFSNTVTHFASNNIEQGFENMKWFEWWKLSDLIATQIVTVFESESIQETYKNAGGIVATKIVDGIEAKLQEDSGLMVSLAGVIAKGIQAAFDDPANTDLQITITPVLNIDGIKQQLADGFGIGKTFNFSTENMGKMVSGIVGSNNQTDEDRVKASELKEQLDTINSSVVNLGNSQVTLGNLVDAFAHMKIITDTKVLAGELTPEIDRLIGQNIWLIEKGVSPSY